MSEVLRSMVNSGCVGFLVKVSRHCVAVTAFSLQQVLSKSKVRQGRHLHQMIHQARKGADLPGAQAKKWFRRFRLTHTSCKWSALECLAGRAEGRTVSTSGVTPVRTREPCPSAQRLARSIRYGKR